MAKSLAAKNDLRALYIKISSERTSDALPLTTIKGLRHLHLQTSLPYPSEVSPLTLIWNSRSTLRSLVLDKSCFQYFYENKMDRTEEPNGSPKRQYDFANLKSLSLKRVSMDPDEVDAITKAIDFTALESIDLYDKNVRISLLHQRLANIFSSTASASIKLRRLWLNLGYQGFTNLGDNTSKPKHEGPGMELISSFDTLTNLTVCDAGIHSSGLPNRGLKDALVQGILKHKNLSTLQFTDSITIPGWKTPYLKPQTVALFIDNLPNLRHFRFYSKTKHLVRLYAREEKEAPINT